MSDSIYSEIPLTTDDIRLIRLSPGRWTDPIRCELLHTSLSANSKYHALSYVWGSKAVTRNILLDGNPFPATVNLEGALRHLRHQHDEGLYLWVDALCINQNDLKERTHQVQLMGRIYESCVSVFVYLGPGIGDTTKHPKQRLVPSVTRFFDDERDRSYFEGLEHGPSAWFNGSKAVTAQNFDTTDVFSLIRSLAQDLHLSASPIFCLQQETRNAQDLRMNLFEALRRMMNPPWTPWWQRIWVVQEVTMPQDVVVVCGSVSSPWRMFAKAASAFTKHSSTCCSRTLEQLPRDQVRVLADFSNRVQDVEKLRRAQARNRIATVAPETDSGPSPAEHDRLLGRLGYMGYRAAKERKTLLNLLQRFRDRKASDPRDKVYALLSLVETGPAGSLLVPDYSLSVKEVFTRATIEIIEASKSLSVLSTDNGRKFRNDLPSWVPNWDAPAGHTNDIRLEAVALYNAPSSSEGFRVPKSPDASLYVRTRGIDLVVELEDVMWGDSASTCQQTLHKWWNNLGLENDQGIAHTISDFWRVLCADVVCLQSNTNSPAQVRRATAEDEIHFVNWAEKSERSPFRWQESDKKFQTPALIGAYRRHGLRNMKLDFNQDFWLDSILSHPARVWKFLLRSGLMSRDSYVRQTDIRDIIERRYPDKCERAMVLESALESLGLHLKGDFLRERFIDDSTRQTRDEAPWGDLVRDAHRYMFEHFGEEYVAVTVDPVSMTESVAAMDASIMAATLSRRLFTTADGSMGLGPADTKQGDQVFFIEGGKTPFLLRYTRDDHTSHLRQYQLVGDCYLQGVMDADHLSPTLTEDSWYYILLE